jgi:dTDP-4-amino-4,6-dideoxygalactose transaminase
VALELALYSLGIGPGDEVIVPSRSFVSSASCIMVRGATPVMVDIDRNSQTVTAEAIASAISPRTRAVIAVHLGGWPCDMDSILKLARQKGIRVIEDCAQAQGAHYKSKPVGGFGDVAAFSFCQDKIMTTGGEGGMLVTNNSGIWESAWSYRDHGRGYDASAAEPQEVGYRWVYESVGTNWRMTEVQSALGRSLLSKVGAWIRRRGELARQLDAALAKIPALRTVVPPEDIGHAYYRYYTFVKPERLRQGWDRDRILRSITAEGIPCFTGSCPELYREKAFAAYRPERRLSVAKELGETSLAFLVHPTMSDADVNDTIQAVEKVMKFASAY